MARFIDLTGRRFGKLTVVRPHGKTKSGKYTWLCRCDCGIEKPIPVSSLRSGHSRSCGCFRTEVLRRPRKHGGAGTAEYRTWKGMRSRCRRKASPEYKNYGGRGITICERWESFKNFLEDMGKRPSLKYSIDRINNDGNYEPGNCRWATKKEQRNNTRHCIYLEIDGEKKTLKQWAAVRGMYYGTVLSRHTRGWPVDRLFTPINHR